LVSIIIPTYNRAHLIAETLDSILSQTYSNWECIIVDDGSTDETSNLVCEYIEKDNRFQYHKRPKDRIKGPNSCRNYGFEICKGDYVKWFDSDDILLPNALELANNCFSKSTDVVVSSLEYIGFNKNKIPKKHVFLSQNVIQNYLTGKITYYICTPTWKKEFLKKQFYLFDETITNLDDWDFNLRMLYEEPNVIYLEQELIQYRVHNTSLSHEISKLNFEEVKSELKAIKKHILLIKNNNKANLNILKKRLKGRCKFILREALVQNNKYKFYYLKELLIIEFRLFSFFDIIKSITGFTIYSLFKKGYRLL
jgi:glycosyltransferase involved in cell wall biosynthesis